MRPHRRHRRCLQRDRRILRGFLVAGVHQRLRKPQFLANQIYRLDLNSGAITRLTRGDSYNEHPRYTPDGQVLWMSNAGNLSHGTDWWAMNPDGSNPQRLSDFNAEAIGHKPVYATVVQTANWGPGNSYFYGDVETNLLNSDSLIARAALTCRGS